MPSDAPGGDLVRSTFDWGDTAPSTAVVRTVAVATDQDPTALTSLNRVVDPDALDALLEMADGPRPTVVRFHYEGTAVRATDGGSVRVRLNGHDRGSTRRP